MTQRVARSGRDHILRWRNSAASSSGYDSRWTGTEEAVVTKQFTYYAMEYCDHPFVFVLGHNQVTGG